MRGCPSAWKARCAARSGPVGFVELVDFISELCRRLQEISLKHGVSCHVAHMMISADKAIPVGLLINELVTNAAKHAYPNGSIQIRVLAERRGENVHVEVSDQSIGLPKDFAIDQPRPSLGFKVSDLARQLNAILECISNQPTGVSIRLDVPLDT